MRVMVFGKATQDSEQSAPPTADAFAAMDRFTEELVKAGILLAAGGLIAAGLGLTFAQVEFIAIGFGLGIVAQGIAICTTTILQREMEDDFRGRVFSVNDMLYNVTFVAGAAVSAAFMPLIASDASLRSVTSSKVPAYSAAPRASSCSSTAWSRKCL